jgi:predicted XRE-type DNA-binding protein
MDVAEIPNFGGAHPLTPIDVQTFSKGEDRARLSGVALKAFRALIEQWALSNAEAAALLGVSDSTWDRIKRGAWDQPMSQDQLTRASAAIGVYKGLHLLFADEMADRWPKLPNRGPIFQRATPIQAMIEGGIPVMLETRRYIDAVRGGL